MNVKLEIHGLRLAAASRVFSINAIWQPNVEAQAIKRAHRIGQMRRCPWKPPSSKKKRLKDQILRRRKQMATAEHRTAEKILLDTR